MCTNSNFSLFFFTFYFNFLITWSVVAVLPVPGLPANKIARPAILPSWIILNTTPIALRAACWPTMPWETSRGSRASSKPKPDEEEWIESQLHAVRDRGAATQLRTQTHLEYANAPQCAPFSSTPIQAFLLGLGPLLQVGPYRQLNSRMANCLENVLICKLSLLPGR